MRKIFQNRIWDAIWTRDLSFILIDSEVVKVLVDNWSDVEDVTLTVSTTVIAQKSFIGSKKVLLIRFAKSDIDR